MYKNKKLTKSSIRNISYYFYIGISIVQLILLTIWSFTNKGIETENRYLEKIGFYKHEKCSIGNEYILNGIFSIDYILLFYSIIISFRIRNSKFNH